jgi:hypothetical protein
LYGVNVDVKKKKSVEEAKKKQRIRTCGTSGSLSPKAEFKPQMGRAANNISAPNPLRSALGTHFKGLFHILVYYNRVRHNYEEDMYSKGYTVNVIWRESTQVSWAKVNYTKNVKLKCVCVWT